MHNVTKPTPVRKLCAAGRIRPTTEILDLVIPRHDGMAFEVMVAAVQIKHARRLGAGVQAVAA